MKSPSAIFFLVVIEAGDASDDDISMRSDAQKLVPLVHPSRDFTVSGGYTTLVSSSPFDSAAPELKDSVLVFVGGTTAPAREHHVVRAEEVEGLVKLVDLFTPLASSTGHPSPPTADCPAPVFSSFGIITFHQVDVLSSGTLELVVLVPYVLPVDRSPGVGQAQDGGHHQEG